MPKLVLSMFMTIDGKFAGPDGTFVGPQWSSDLQRHWADDAIDRAGTLVYGRVNFAFNAAFWQDAETNAASPDDLRAFARRMNALPKVVFSRTLAGDPGWNGRLAGPDMDAAVARLKAAGGKDLYCFGGANLAASLIGRDLVDRYRLMIEPTLLGDGEPLFKASTVHRRLDLVETKALDTGAVILTYERRPGP